MTTAEWEAVAALVAAGNEVDLDFDAAADPIDLTVDVARAVFVINGAADSYYGSAEDSGAWKLRVAKG